MAQNVTLGWMVVAAIVDAPVRASWQRVERSKASGRSASSTTRTTRRMARGWRMKAP
jgi:hypothetical protein